MSFSFFGDLFDINGDGELDIVEEAMDFHAFQMMREQEKRDRLESHGIDTTEFEFLDDYDRRTVLENARLDPDDYEFY